MMMELRKHLLVGILALGLGVGSLSAYAQRPDSGPMGEHPGWGERMAKRHAELHDKLKLNANQETAWNAYIAKVKPADRPPHPDRAELDKLSAPERMEKMLEFMKAGEKRLTEVLAATKEFYAVLTPEQQKIFNDEFARRHGHHGRGPAR
jgi:protein CpxP